MQRSHDNSSSKGWGCTDFFFATAELRRPRRQLSLSRLTLVPSASSFACARPAAAEAAAAARVGALLHGTFALGFGLHGFGKELRLGRQHHELLNEPNLNGRTPPLQLDLHNTHTRACW
jgi:hypothetical protein